MAQNLVLFAIFTWICPAACTVCKHNMSVAGSTRSVEQAIGSVVDLQVTLPLFSKDSGATVVFVNQTDTQAADRCVSNLSGCLSCQNFSENLQILCVKEKNNFTLNFKLKITAKENMTSLQILRDGVKCEAKSPLITAHYCLSTELPSDLIPVGIINKLYEFGEMIGMKCAKGIMSTRYDTSHQQINVRCLKNAKWYITEYGCLSECPDGNSSFVTSEGSSVWTVGSTITIQIALSSSKLYNRLTRAEIWIELIDVNDSTVIYLCKCRRGLFRHCNCANKTLLTSVTSYDISIQVTDLVEALNMTRVQMRPSLRYWRHDPSIMCVITSPAIIINYCFSSNLPSNLHPLQRFDRTYSFGDTLEVNCTKGAMYGSNFESISSLTAICSQHVKWDVSQYYCIEEQVIDFTQTNVSIKANSSVVFVCHGNIDDADNQYAIYMDRKLVAPPKRLSTLVNYSLTQDFNGKVVTCRHSYLKNGSYKETRAILDVQYGPYLLTSSLVFHMEEDTPGTAIFEISAIPPIVLSDVSILKDNTKMHNYYLESEGNTQNIIFHFLKVKGSSFGIYELNVHSKRILSPIRENFSIQPISSSLTLTFGAGIGTGIAVLLAFLLITYLLILLFRHLRSRKSKSVNTKNPKFDQEGTSSFQVTEDQEGFYEPTGGVVLNRSQVTSSFSKNAELSSSNYYEAQIRESSTNNSVGAHLYYSNQRVQESAYEEYAPVNQ